MVKKIILIVILLVAITGGLFIVSKFKDNFEYELPALSLEETDEDSSSKEKSIDNENINESITDEIENTNIEADETDEIEFTVDDSNNDTSTDTSNNASTKNDSNSSNESNTNELEIRKDKNGNIILPKVKFTSNQN